jgi:hypothetical protein
MAEGRKAARLNSASCLSQLACAAPSRCLQCLDEYRRKEPDIPRIGTATAGHNGIEASQRPLITEATP